METAMKCRGYQLLFVTLILFFSSQATDAQLNYTFLYVNTNSYTANSGGTTIINGNTDDGISAIQNIGFTFTYNCNTYTQFMVSSNGWMVLGGGMTGSRPGNNLNVLTEGPILAPLWDDMKIANGANVNIKLTGSAGSRIMTIEWNKVLWNSSATNPALSYQVKLYEGTNVIEFVYFREAGSSTVVNASGSVGIASGTSATDIYSVDIVANAASYGYDQSTQNARPAGGRTYRWTPTTMSYTSTTATQASIANVTKCNPNDQVILGVQVVTSGSCSPYSVTQFQMNMTGSTAITDVSKIHIYYTGLSSGFAPVNEFLPGGTSPAAGNFNITSTQVLKGGTNYFWVAYDITAAAVIGHVLDAQCLSVTISGGVGAKTPTTTNPAGSRPIANCAVAPGGVDGASFWVKASAGIASPTDGGQVAAWNDLSANGRNATQSTAANMPTYFNNSTDNMNFNPVVNFDAASQVAANGDYMDIASNGILSPGNNPYTVYSVIRPGTGNTGGSPGKYLFTGQPGANNFNAFDVRTGGRYNDSWNLNDLIVGSQWTSGYPSMATFNYNTSQREMFVSGNSVGTRAGNDRISPDANNAIGCQRSNVPLIEFYDGDIAELITFANYSHTTAQRYQVETYLGIKYGMTLPHNYVASDGTTVWNTATNAFYNTNIIGIGRDDNGALSQKESKSTSLVQDMLTLYIGAAKTADQASNTGTFAAGDKSFFMAANNNAAYTYPGGVPERPAGICCRLQREWLAQKTNFTNTDLKLEFDFNIITPGYTALNAADLRLLVDADGDFTNATILSSPAITINVASSKVTITVPASTFTATPYFTLGSVSVTSLLPVDITGFAGLCKNNTVQLGWTKQSGPDNRFSVERSGDGIHFNVVGALQSNSAASQSYTWTDAAPLTGNNYYRLKMEGADAVTAYSDVLLINPCSRNSLQLATDGVTGESSLIMQLPQNAVVDISLGDMLGRQYEINGITGHRAMQPGYYRLPVTDRRLAKGIYVLSVAINGNKTVYRLMQP